MKAAAASRSKKAKAGRGSAGGLGRREGGGEVSATPSGPDKIRAFRTKALSCVTAKHVLPQRFLPAHASSASLRPGRAGMRTNATEHRPYAHTGSRSYRCRPHPVLIRACSLQEVRRSAQHGHRDITPLPTVSAVLHACTVLHNIIRRQR